MWQRHFDDLASEAGELLDCRFDGFSRFRFEPFSKIFFRNPNFQPFSRFIEFRDIVRHGQFGGSRVHRIAAGNGSQNNRSIFHGLRQRALRHLCGPHAHVLNDRRVDADVGAGGIGVDRYEVHSHRALAGVIRNRRGPEHRVPPVKDLALGGARGGGAAASHRRQGHVADGAGPRMVLNHLRVHAAVPELLFLCIRGGTLLAPAAAL